MKYFFKYSSYVGLMISRLHTIQLTRHFIFMIRLNTCPRGEESLNTFQTKAGNPPLKLLCLVNDCIVVNKGIFVVCFKKIGLSTFQHKKLHLYFYIGKCNGISMLYNG